MSLQKTNSKKNSFLSDVKHFFKKPSTGYENKPTSDHEYNSDFLEKKIRKNILMKIKEMHEMTLQTKIKKEVKK